MLPAPSLEASSGEPALGRQADGTVSSISFNYLKNSAPLTQLKALLRQTLRVTTNDGRLFLGSFAGTDKQLNIIIINAEEYRLVGDEHGGRYVGQVMIPWKFVVRVEAQGEGVESQGRASQRSGDSSSHKDLYI